MSEQICKTERSPPPLEHETLTPSFPCVRLLLQSSRQEKTEKREKNGLTFAGEGVYCCLETGFASARKPDPSSFHRIFQQKTCKPASFKFCSFAPEIEMPAQEDCVFVSCWAFPCSFQERVWQDLHVTYGNRPAFLFSGGSINELKRTRTTSIHPQINETNLNKKPANRREKTSEARKNIEKSLVSR